MAANGEDNVEPWMFHNVNAQEAAAIARSNVGGMLSLVRYFTGEPNSTSVTEFIQSIESAARLGVWTQGQILTVLKTRVAGPAAAFFEGNTDLNNADWATVKARLISFFDEETDQTNHFAEFNSCNQRPGESAKLFLLRLQQLGAKAARALAQPGQEPHTALIDGMMLNRFLAGIRTENGKLMITMQRPNTIQDALKLATLFDAGKDTAGASRVRVVGTGSQNDTGRVQFEVAENTETRTCAKCGGLGHTATVCPTQARAESNQNESSEIVSLFKELKAILQEKQNPQSQGNQQWQDNPQRVQQPRGYFHQSQDYRQNQEQFRPRFPAPQVTCFKCKQVGHYAPDCSAQRHNAMPLRCNYCQNLGHHINECRKKQYNNNRILQFSNQGNPQFSNQSQPSGNQRNGQSGSSDHLQVKQRENQSATQNPMKVTNAQSQENKDF